MEIEQQQDHLPGMYVDKKNSGGKCEQFWEVGVVDNLFPIDVLYTHFSSILVPKVVMDSLNQLLSKAI